MNTENEIRNDLIIYTINMAKVKNVITIKLWKMMNLIDSAIIRSFKYESYNEDIAKDYINENINNINE